MSIVELHNTRFSDDIRRFTLRRPSTQPIFSADSTTPLHLSISMQPWEIGKGRIGRVFRGSLRCDDPPSPDAYDIVIKLVAPHAKFVLHDGRPHRVYHQSQRTLGQAEQLLADLESEAAKYAEDLRDLQGRVIPRFYGFGMSEDGQAAVMILEDVGSPLTFSYPRLPVEDRLVLFRHQIAIHQRGISHGDLASRNFVKGPQSIRIIDFDRAILHHDCPIFSTDISVPELLITLEEASRPHPCEILDKWRKRLGFCTQYELTSKQWAAFEPWNGPPWGEEPPSEHGRGTVQGNEAA